jgi:hypothetical protein
VRRGGGPAYTVAECRKPTRDRPLGVVWGRRWAGGLLLQFPIDSFICSFMYSFMCHAFMDLSKLHLGLQLPVQWRCMFP